MLRHVHSPRYLAAFAILRTLRDAGHQAYFAGGCVRDLLLGDDPKDFDVATSATPDQVVALFPRTQAVGVHFGVILVLSDLSTDVSEGKADASQPERIATEVATFRHDGVYSDGRRPDTVRYSTEAREDVQRRDFTINGMLLDPVVYQATRNLKLSVLDYVEGRKDLAAHTIRAIGDPATRFAEDKLRMLRAVRFAARLNFKIAPATLAAIRQQAESVTQVSRERIREELTRMLTDGHARRAFELLHDSRLLEHVLPEVTRLRGVAQPPQFHPEGDVWVHTLLLLEQFPTGVCPTLAWGALLHDIGKPATYQPPDPAIPNDRIRFNGHADVGARIAELLLERLRFSREDIDQIVALVKNHMRFADVEHMREATLKRFFRLPRFPEHLELHRIDCNAAHGDLRLYDFAKQRYETATPEKIRPRLLVTGRDLIAAGYRPGTQFKQMLEAAEDAQLENQVTSRTEAMKLLRERFGAPPQAFSTLTSA
ncbi:MAG TPA: HD domain-containing protein [Granulicella sp.]|jgi:poly(A) polymerase|nr:HD domain-containing protein [Granulicella sp.]